MQTRLFFAGYLSAVLSVAACAAVEGGKPDPGPGTHRGSDVGSDEVGSGGPGGSGSGSSSGSGSTTVTLSGTVYDERNDTIDFSNGNPVHTHHGAPIALGSGCPDVYLFAYLTDAEAPLFGGETSPNPLAWQVTATSAAGIDPSASQYRVRASDGSILVDWTPLTEQAGVLEAVLHRDGPQAIRKLGTDAFVANLDVEATDTLGNAGSATSCVSYHPLAAPLDIQPIAEETTGEALFAMTFAAASPISDVIQDTSPVPSVFGERFIQHTAESVSAVVTFAIPSAQYAKTVATVFVQQSGGVLACGNTEQLSSDPRCATLTNVTNSSVSSSGAVASGLWSVGVVDESNSQAIAPCTVEGLIATCAIPARQAGELPHAYRFVASANNFTDLVPGTGGPYGEFTVAGRTYTGEAPTSVSKCTSRTTTFIHDLAYFTCAYETYAKVVALSAAELAFSPAAVQFSTSVGADVTLAPVTYQPSPIVSGPTTWNAGEAVLPGT